jgi:cytochrome P450
MTFAANHQQFSFSALKRGYTNPHKLYDDLRATDPIYFDALSQCWIVTGYAEIITILEDERFTSDLGTYSPKSAMGWDAVQETLSQSVFFKDGKEHLEANHYLLKHIAQRARRLTNDIKTIVHQRFSTLAPNGSMDLVKDFASAISFAVTLRLLGIDINDPQEFLRFLGYSETISDIASGYPVGNIQDITTLISFLRQQVAHKKKAPSDDLISAFHAAPDIFPHEEAVLSSTLMILTAGHVTTKKLIGTGTAKILDHWPQLQAELADNPALPKLICEEALRMSPPTRYIARWAREDADLSAQYPGNHYIRQGQKILLFLEAANYDPRHFEHPKEFHLAHGPVKHLTFGFGQHRCPGASIARLEAHASLQALLRLSHLAPHPDRAAVWNPNPILGGFRSCPVIFDPHQ